MQTDAKILLPFLRSGEAFVSGTAIAHRLGLSRVSVHNRLENLRQEGFQFDAIRNRGYRLSAEPLTFHPALFEALLQHEPCPFIRHVFPFDAVGSTNDIAAEKLSEETEAPFIVVANSQSAGRGRRGRFWHSPHAHNLYLSLGLRPRLPPARLQTITLWLGLSLCRFIRNTHGLPVMLKWPNDLLLHGRKIAGMLTEARVDAELTRDLVFGLGLNVNAGETDFPSELAPVAGSLALNLGYPLPLTRLAHGLVACLAEAVQVFLDDARPPPELADLWPEFDYLRGQRVHTGAVEGIASGITGNGSLRVLRDDGSTALLHSGEVSLLKG
ncbi:MAG: biotin--[acetyl-CoA-carboxylase] ligase [Oceanipulchritudo sp.]